MESEILNTLFNLESFEKVEDKNIERYNNEAQKDLEGTFLHIEDIIKLIKESGKLDLFIESMNNIKKKVKYDR